MKCSPLIVRSMLLLLVGGLAVHQLRYLLSVGQSASGALTAHGHGGLALAAPIITVTAALALSVLLVRSAAAPGRAVIRVRLVRLWPIASASLFALYAGEEVLHGALTHGHASGLVGVFGTGGWVAIPISIALGAVIAYAIRLADLLEERTFGPRLRVAVRLLGDPAPVQSLAPMVAAPSPPSRLLSGRGPPLG